MDIQRIPIHQSLHRHTHVLGAERELVLSSALIAFLVGIGGLTALSAACAGLYWLVTIFVLRRMAKADPMMSKVWLRHVKQQDYYAPRARIWRRV
jgi:type IV secretion system protein VirB3/type IV secretion system protein VirB4